MFHFDVTTLRIKKKLLKFWIPSDFSEGFRKRWPRQRYPQATQKCGENNSTA